MNDDINKELVIIKYNRYGNFIQYLCNTRNFFRDLEHMVTLSSICCLKASGKKSYNSAKYDMIRVKEE
jgi:hypothetical protein